MPLLVRRLTVLSASLLVAMLLGLVFEASPARAATSMDDDFNASTLNTNRWTQVIVPSGSGTVAVSNQRLEMTAGPSQAYVAVQGACVVSGDFDVQVDYR